ncbi:hypothetical protein AMTRI_Chr10g3060 [Amborella trichopoda]
MVFLNGVVNGAEEKLWCIADFQIPAEVLQREMDLICNGGGTDCSAISPGGACYDPNTLLGHASYAYNTYWQNNKHNTGCYMNAAAIQTINDPSHGSCIFEFIPF